MGRPSGAWCTKLYVVGTPIGNLDDITSARRTAELVERLAELITNADAPLSAT